MKSYGVELVGTFFLTLTVALTGNPIAVGAVLVALVYMGGYVSGAHYNPAVTLSMLLLKKITPQKAAIYMGVQMVGGVLASGTYLLLRNHAFLIRPGASLSQALLVEILFTFLLATVILHTASTKKTQGNDYYGLAIGLTLMAAAYAGGRISGGAYNPAVGLSPLVISYGYIKTNLVLLLLYGAGPLAGGALASLFYKLK